MYCFLSDIFFGLVFLRWFRHCLFSFAFHVCCTKNLTHNSRFTICLHIPAICNARPQSSSSTANRPVFLGNLSHSVNVSDVEKIFADPITDDGTAPISVDRVDLKRGFCFVFLKDAGNQEEKDRAESYVSRINGMYVPTIGTTNG